MRRADASELNAVRDGAMSFEALQSVANELQAKMLVLAVGAPEMTVRTRVFPAEKKPRAQRSVERRSPGCEVPHTVVD